MQLRRLAEKGLSSCVVARDELIGLPLRGRCGDMEYREADAHRSAVSFSGVVGEEDGVEAPGSAGSLTGVAGDEGGVRVHLDTARLMGDAQIDALSRAQLTLLAWEERLLLERRQLHDEAQRFRDTLAAERAEMEAALARQRVELEMERAAMEEERDAARCVIEAQDDVVLLDVGGVPYKTSRATLTSVPGSMLEAMFSGRHADIPSETDRPLFIDRDGALFAQILSFLRDHRLCAKNRSTEFAIEPATVTGVLSVDAASRSRRGRPHTDWRIGENKLSTLSVFEQQSLRREADYFGLEEAMFPCARRIIVFCGRDDTWGLDSTEVLDLPSMTFQPGPPTTCRRNFCAAAPLDKHRVIVIGGVNESGRTNSSEILDLTCMTFSDGPRLCRKRSGCAVASQGRFLVVFGGFDGSTWLDTTEVLDLEAATLEFVPGPRLRTPRNFAAACALDERRMLVAGGSDGSAVFFDTTEVFNVTPTDGGMSVSAGPVMSTCRDGCAASRIDDRRILVLGGYDGDGWLDSTEVLDLDTMSFAAGPRMATPRNFCTAVTPERCQVFVFGGHNGQSRLDAGEMLCALQAGAGPEFEKAPCLATPRSGCAAVAC